MERGQRSSKICLFVIEMSKELQWAGGQWARSSDVHEPVQSGQHLVIWAGECLACHTPACSEGLG